MPYGILFGEGKKVWILEERDGSKQAEKGERDVGVAVPSILRGTLCKL